MKLLKSSLLASAAGLAAVGAARPPICRSRRPSRSSSSAFAPPTARASSTSRHRHRPCLPLSGRARFEYGYQAPLGRGQGNGDYSGYRGLARINVDARTQTGYGTLRAFLRIEAASRTGIPTLHSGTQIRIANAFPGTGIDQFGRVEQY